MKTKKAQEVTQKNHKDTMKKKFILSILMFALTALFLILFVTQSRSDLIIQVINRENEEQWADMEMNNNTSLTTVKTDIANHFALPEHRIMLFDSRFGPLQGETIQNAGLSHGDSIYFAVAPEQPTAVVEVVEKTEQETETKSAEEKKDVEEVKERDL